MITGNNVIKQGLSSEHEHEQEYFWVNQNEYWLIRLGASRLLPAAFSAGGVRRFRFHLTGVSDLLAAQNWSDLSGRYASIVERGGTAI